MKKPFIIRSAQVWQGPKPASLSLLDRQHVMLHDVENFWGELSIALDHREETGARCCGIDFYHSVIPSSVMEPYIANLLPGEIDWTTLKVGEETVVIVHYVVIWNKEDYLETSSGPKLTIHISLIADSTVAIAKLRLMGDQIIQEKRSFHLT